MPLDQTIFDHTLDLAFARHTKVSRAALWRGWTEPELIQQWFTPAPWRTVACEIDLKPGGIFHTLMRSPDGQEFDNTGCYLEVVTARRLVWTNALGPGFRPAPVKEWPFTAIVEFADRDGGTQYTARVLHKDAVDKDKHAAMRFEAGWGKAFEQLVALIEQLRL